MKPLMSPKAHQRAQTREEDEERERRKEALCSRRAQWWRGLVSSLKLSRQACRKWHKPLFPTTSSPQPTCQHKGKTVLQTEPVDKRPKRDLIRLENKF
ncbi:hypothetical protein YC2023_110141 [Brassica napus]